MPSIKTTTKGRNRIHPAEVGTEEAGWITKLEQAYKEGASDEEVCALLNITYPKFMEYYSTNSNFQELVDIGRTLSKAWWIGQGRRNIKDKTFNTSLWAFNMKNLFGWSEKTQVEDTNRKGQGESLDEISSKLRKTLPAVLKTLYPDMQNSQLLSRFSKADPSLSSKASG